MQHPLTDTSQSQICSAYTTLTLRAAVSEQLNGSVTLKCDLNAERCTPVLLFIAGAV